MAETKRWRADKWGEYFMVDIHNNSGIQRMIDCRKLIDSSNFNLRNYFRTGGEAEAVAHEIRKVLLRHVGELHDFAWAVDEMKKGNKVRCSSWGVLCHLEIKHLYEGSNFYGILDQEGNHYELSLSDLAATDWEIYRGGEIEIQF